ncbi:hypothetical protein [uncultured Roseibium sp.]|uniref:hypothetical protein n=1 Tax=uncultured Roseibium sp. TaxID=1936171 RepID=UPI003217B3DC
MSIASAIEFMSGLSVGHSGRYRQSSAGESSSAVSAGAAETTSYSEIHAAVNGDRQAEKPDLNMIAARHDPKSISPREIDQLSKELKSAGYAPLADIMMLETHGEDFQMHMRETAARISGTEPGPFDPNRKTDLTAVIAGQRDMAEARGEPTKGLDAIQHLFAVLNEARGEADGNEPVHARTTGSLSLESLLALQAE